MSEDASLDPTLGELITHSAASVRLTNCVQRSRLDGMTLAHALKLGPGLITIAMQVPSMGRKSALELRDIVARFAAQSDTVLRSSPVADDSVTVRQKLRVGAAELFAKVTLLEVLDSLGGSVRLMNGIDVSPWRDRPLKALLSDWREVRQSFLAQRNFGRSSLQELTEICIGVVVSYVKASGMAEPLAAALKAVLFDVEDAGDAPPENLNEFLSNAPQFGLYMLHSEQVLPPEDLICNLLKSLDDRPRDIIVRRYGLLATPPETLEQIAGRYGVTRERIRQLESKGLKSLVLTGRKSRAKESLSRHAPEIWRSLSGSDDFVSQTEVSDRVDAQPGINLLAAVAELSASQLLDAIAVRWRAGWCRRGIDTAELERLDTAFRSELAGKMLPRPVPAIASTESGSEGLISLRAGLQLEVHEGYVLNPSAARRGQIRAIELHRLTKDVSRPSRTASLAARLNDRLDEPPVAARYVAMLMERNPHLFLEADDGRWFGLGGLRMPHSESASSPRTTPDLPDEQDDDEFRMASYLRSILLAAGPTKFSHLVELAAIDLPADRSIASVGPTLIQHPEIFVRVLPGVYGLYAHLPAAKELIDDQPGYLLNEVQARLYALARRAGEPWGAFPLWTPTTEALLCNWALHNASADLFESLMTVANFDEWPVGQASRKSWKDFSAEHPSGFHLHFEPRESIGYAPPSLERLLAACLQASADGHFNWMVANRLLKKPVHSHKSAGLMAMMGSLDALEMEEGEHWQRRHSGGPRIEHLILLLSNEKQRSGELSWDSGIGTKLISEAGAALGKPRGWIDRQLLAIMLAQLSTDEGACDLIQQAVQAELDEIEWVSVDFDGAAQLLPGDRILAGYSALQVTAARVISDDEAEWAFEDDFTD